MTETNLTTRLAEAWSKRRHPESALTDHARARFVLPTRSLPRYAYDRIAIRARTLVHGRQPWITADALDHLEQLLQPTDRGLEYGPGGTTPWFGRRVAHVDSVEAFDHWFQPLKQQLETEGIGTVDLHLVSANELGLYSPEHQEAYVNILPELEAGSLDFVFVDGEYRDACALRGIELLRSGGLLILDNATTYLPGDTRSPWRAEAPVTPVWEEFTEQVSTWRRLWTTNGVWDTVIWLKP
jgi:hypothetical protein